MGLAVKRLLPFLLIPILVVWLAAPRSSSQLGAGTTGFETTTGAASQGSGSSPTPSGPTADEGTDSGTARGMSAHGGAPNPTTLLGDWSCSAPPLCGETPQPRIVDGISGTATFYCRPGISRCTVGYPFGMYAAAGPKLRTMLGPDWRGRTVVVVDANGRGVLVQLIDFCACGGDHVIDLYWTAYQGLVNPVTVKEEP